MNGAARTGASFSGWLVRTQEHRDAVVNVSLQTGLVHAADIELGSQLLFRFEHAKKLPCRMTRVFDPQSSCSILGLQVAGHRLHRLQRPLLEINPSQLRVCLGAPGAYGMHPGSHGTGDQLQDTPGDHRQHPLRTLIEVHVH